MQPTFLEIDNLNFPLLHPGTVEELAQTVKSARSKEEAIFPVGGGTRLSLGLPPNKMGTAVAMKGISRVVDYPARDMTITVQAGMTVGESQRLLATENLRLPIDVPFPDQATLGGILATNESGLRRFGFGTLRDYVIGISVINDEGQEVKAGGRVVKNVAGYDLCKLYIGALGTLGIITQITFKVVPRPEWNALLALSCEAKSVELLLNLLHETRTRPVALELLNPPAVHHINQQTGLSLPTKKNSVVVGYEGNTDAVKWQVQQLVKEVKTDFPLEARIGPTAQELWKALVQFPGWKEARLTLKATMLPSKCSHFCQQLSAWNQGILIQAHAGNGIVLAHFPGNISLEEASSLVDKARKLLGNMGSLVVAKAPPEWKKSIPVWGPNTGTVTLMRAIKNKLDPKGIFNPGRFIDGI